MSKKKILLFGSQSEIGQKIYEVLNEENLVIPLHRGFKFRKEHFELTYDSFDKAIEWCSFSKEYIYDADITIFNQAFTSLLSLENINNIELSKSFQVNVFFPTAIIKFLLSQNLSKRRKFIFLSSIAGSFRSSTASMAYSSSKRALNGIIKHLSLEKGGEADFIGIAPSQVDSKQLREKIPESKIKELKQKNPTNSICKVEEIASFVKYIVDHPGSSFNGSIFDMNGGIF